MLRDRVNGILPAGRSGELSACLRVDHRVGYTFIEKRFDVGQKDRAENLLSRLGKLAKELWMEGKNEDRLCIPADLERLYGIPLWPMVPNR